MIKVSLHSGCSKNILSSSSRLINSSFDIFAFSLDTFNFRYVSGFDILFLIFSKPLFILLASNLSLINLRFSLTFLSAFQSSMRISTTSSRIYWRIRVYDVYFPKHSIHALKYISVQSADTAKLIFNHMLCSSSLIP